MNSYLVDYENVGPGGLNGIDTLNEENIIHIFYSTNADKLTFELHVKLNQSKSKIFYHKVDTSHKNALDFQLSSYLGWLVHENPEHNYFVVSKDTGFNALLPLWKKLRANVSIVADLTKKNVQENNNKWHTLYTHTWPNYDIWGSYQNEVQSMKEWLNARFEWLKTEFDKM